MTCEITQKECPRFIDGECHSVTGADCPGNNYEDARACVEALAITQEMMKEGVST